MVMGKKLLVVLLCCRLAGVCWGQGMSALDYLGEGIAAYEAGQWQACVDALEKARAQSFGNPLYQLDALVFLGRAYARLGHQDRALVHFREVLKLQPDYRLDPTDPAGLVLFGKLLRDDVKERGKVAEGRNFPLGKVVVGAGGIASVVVILQLLSGGGRNGIEDGIEDGGESPQPGQDEGSIGGIVVLP